MEAGRGGGAGDELDIAAGGTEEERSSTGGRHLVLQSHKETSVELCE